jgi:hypothetical protein
MKTRTEFTPVVRVKTLSRRLHVLNLQKLMQEKSGDPNTTKRVGDVYLQTDTAEERAHRRGIDD